MRLFFFRSKRGAPVMVAVRSGEVVQPIEQFTGTSLRGVGDDGALKHFVQFFDHAEKPPLCDALLCFKYFRRQFEHAAIHVHNFKLLQIEGVARPFENIAAKRFASFASFSYSSSNGLLAITSRRSFRT